MCSGWDHFKGMYFSTLKMKCYFTAAGDSQFLLGLLLLSVSGQFTMMVADRWLTQFTSRFFIQRILRNFTLNSVCAPVHFSEITFI